MNRFWFAPASPTNLGVCRLLIFSAFLIRYLILPPNVGQFTETFAAFWKPVPLLGLFQFPVLSTPWLKVLEIVWLCALGTSALGFFTRVSTALSFTLGLYLLWIPHNFGKLHHTDMITVIVMGILALSRCGDAWSLDRRFKRRPEAPAPSGEYTWPIRMVWLAMACIFFAAGFAKLRHSGLAWIFSDNMALMLIKVNYLAYIDYPPLVSWGLWMGRQVWLCRIFAAVTVLVEILYPLALVSRIARRILVPSMFAILIGILLVFLPSFAELIVCHVFWVPWDRAGRWWAARFRQPVPAMESLWPGFKTPPSI